MDNLKAIPLRVHEKAKLSIDVLDDRLELKLINKDTGESIEEPYFKLDSGIDINEAMKIDIIVYHMHNKIGLNLWESN